MLRRKIVAYTMMLIAGISAGYFIFERIKPVCGTVFLVGMGLAIALIEPDTVKKKTDDEKMLCFIIMLIGFMIFAINYAQFEFVHSEEEQLRIHGRIINAEDRGKTLRLVIDDDLSKRKLVANIKKSEEDKADIAYYIGSSAELTGEVRELAEADNPGCFDYRRYMRSKDISYSVKAYSVTVTDDDVGAVWNLRKKLIREREKFLNSFDEEISSFLRGMIFGDKSEIDEEVLREFNLNSSGHILAVSGLHIGFLYALLKLLSGGKKTLTVSIVIILILVLYGEMTLWSSSTVRAVTVLALHILSVNLRRPFDLLSSLAASAFMILLFRPYMLFNTGFQLSFAAMGSIAILSKYLSAVMGNILGAAASVQIGTIPLIAMSFHKVNSIAVFINLPIILLSSFIVPLCILVLTVGMITTEIPEVCINAVSFLAESLISLNRFLVFDGGFSNLASGAGAAWTGALYVLVFVLASEWLRVSVIRKEYSYIGKSIMLLLIPLLMSFICLFDAFRNDEIVFVSVGQGDCTHIRYAGEDILIDGGGSEFVNTGERVLMPYLLSQGAKDVDLALLTHLHKDHYQGVSELSDIYPIKAIAMPADYRESFEESMNRKEDSENNISFTTNQFIYLNQRSRIDIADDVYVEVLWPLEKDFKRVKIEDENEHNMVYMIHYYGRKIMVTGDLLEEDEIKMLRHYRGSDELKCDVLKVAHHGSKSSSSEEFLDAANPEFAVIQVGRGNFYGHPHAQTIERLQERSVKIFRTDSDGAVGVDIAPKSGKIRIHTMH